MNNPYLDNYNPIKIAVGRYFPLGLGYLGVVLKKRGYQVHYIDPEAKGWVLKILKNFFG